MTPDAARLEELLLEWEERCDAGEAVILEVLCADTPALLPELRRRTEMLRRFKGLEEPEAAAPPMPTALGRYVVKRELGGGISGVVYLAKDRALRRKVAIKLLSPRLGFLTADERQRLRRRFDREAQTLAKLKHEAIVPVYEADLGEQQAYFVMEYLPGGSLKDRLTGPCRAPWPPADVAVFMARITGAVVYAHGQGLLHRDLKPANILLDHEGRPKVSDLGLVKLLDDTRLERDDSSAMMVNGTIAAGEDSTLTLPGREPGTPAYMAPEQFDPRRGPVERPADIWALGAIFYELLTGRRPFPGEGRAELQRRICCERPAAPAVLNSRVDVCLARLAMRCLDADPLRRPTAAALVDALACYLHPSPVRRLANATMGMCRPIWEVLMRRGPTPNA